MSQVKDFFCKLLKKQFLTSLCVAVAVELELYVEVVLMGAVLEEVYSQNSIQIVEFLIHY